MKSLVIFSWASQSFLYEDMLANRKDMCKLKVIRVAHCNGWFELGKQKYLKECFNLISVFLFPLALRVNSPVVLFGTNLVKLAWIPLLFKKRKCFIVNEFPTNCEKRFSIFETIMFKLNSQYIFVSSDERRNLIEDKFRVRLGGVIPNLVSSMASETSTNKKIESKLNKAIYAGLINKNRFNKATLHVLDTLGISVDLYGPNIDGISFDNFQNLTYLGSLTSSDLGKKIPCYKFSLVVYPTTDINNDLCAPIKIYEYIKSKSICICLNNNKGLENFVKNYPKLFIDNKTLKIDEMEFDEVESKAFFDAVIDQLENNVNLMHNLLAS